MFDLKNLFWNNLLKHYPQYNWSQAILHEIEKLDIDNDTCIYDAPCGNGAIFWLNKNYHKILNYMTTRNFSPELYHSGQKITETL